MSAMTSMTPFQLSPQTIQDIEIALGVDGMGNPGLQNTNYVTAYKDIYNDLVAQNALGNTVNSGTFSWFQQAYLVDEQQWVPTAQGTFIWNYTEAAAESEGQTITTDDLQKASNAIALAVFKQLRDASYVFTDANVANGFGTREITKDDAGAGIGVLQNLYPAANLDFAIWGGSLFARTELQDPTYFSDYNIQLQPDTRDADAILSGLAAGSAAVLATFPSSIFLNGLIEGLGNLDFGAISAVMTNGEKALLGWSVITAGVIILTPDQLLSGSSYILDSSQSTLINFSGDASSSTDRVEVINADSQQPDYELVIDKTNDGSTEILIDSGASGLSPILVYPSGGLAGDTIEIAENSNGVLELTTRIGNGSTAVIASNYSVNNIIESFNFSGSAGTLRISNASAFSGTIANFIAGDTIDLAGISATAAYLSPFGNVLDVQLSNGSIIPLNVASIQSDLGFLAIPDNNGGTDIIAGQKGDIPGPPTGGPIRIPPGPNRVVLPQGASGLYTITNDSHDIVSVFIPHVLANGVLDPLPDNSEFEIFTSYDDWAAAYNSFNSGGELGPFDLTVEFASSSPDFTGPKLVWLNPQPNDEDPSIPYYDLSMILYPIACFCAGTRIAIPGGEIPIERLRIGDVVQTRDFAREPIKWIGRRRIDCLRHPNPKTVWPVRVHAEAFGPELPGRDLWLSPDHAVFVDNVLIPIKHLINGCTITQESCDEVTYYHVEFEQHDVVYAEGLPAESYLDTGDRSNFENGGVPMRLHPDFSARMWEAKGYAPLTVTGPILAAVRARLLQYAAKLANRPRRNPKTTRSA